MKKFRYKNWLVLLSILIAYGVMGYYNGFLNGFLQGALLTASLIIIIGELYWIITGKDMKWYLLGGSNTQDQYLG
jgi:hypothetical protein